MNDDKQAVHILRRPLKKAAAVLLLSSGCNKAQPETELFSPLIGETGAGTEAGAGGTARERT